VLGGHLDLVCAARSSGESYLARQSFCAPIHLSKPHQDEGALVVNVVNPTAGLLAGDRIALRIAVEEGARLLLTAPSASRAHCTGDGEAEMTQDFHVEAGGSLESLPELFIPQRGARYRQTTTIDLQPGGELLFFETLAPGRVAMGEAFAYARLQWATDLYLGGNLIVRERYELAPGSAALRALQSQFPAGYYGSCWVLSPQLSERSSCWSAIHGLHEPSAWVGCSELYRSGWSIKVLADSSVLLRRKMNAIRQEIYVSLGRPAPALRRSA
jgi:urease accessory protein